MASSSGSRASAAPLGFFSSFRPTTLLAVAGEAAAAAAGAVAVAAGTCVSGRSSASRRSRSAMFSALDPGVPKECLRPLGGRCAVVTATVAAAAALGDSPPDSFKSLEETEPCSSMPDSARERPPPIPPRDGDRGAAPNPTPAPPPRGVGDRGSTSKPSQPGTMGATYTGAKGVITGEENPPGNGTGDDVDDAARLVPSDACSAGEAARLPKLETPPKLRRGALPLLKLPPLPPAPAAPSLQPTRLNPVTVAGDTKPCTGAGLRRRALPCWLLLMEPLLPPPAPLALKEPPPGTG